LEIQLRFIAEVEVKLERANTLIEELEQSLKPFLGDENFFVEKLKIDEYVWDLVIRMKSQPPLKFGVMIGEIVHNLRSSLDVGLFQLLELAFPVEFSSLNDKERGKISFPVYKNELNFQKSNWSASLADEQLLSDLATVQPFRNLKFASNDDEKKLIIETTPLQELHSLWNKDKHRGIHLVVGGLDMLALSLEDNDSVEWQVIDPPPWVDGSKPFRIIYNTDAHKDRLILSEAFAVGLPSDVRPLQVYPVVEKLKALVKHVEYCHFLMVRWYKFRANGVRNHG